MLVVPAVVIGVALLGWAGYEMYSRAAGRRAALLARIRQDPGDFIRARLNEESPHQFELNRYVEAADRAHADARDRRAAIGRELIGDPPPRKWTVVVLAVCALWAVAFAVQFLLDLRVAMAVTGAIGSAVLTASILAGMLSATTLGASMLWDRRAGVTPRTLHVGLLAAAAVFCAVLSIVVTLAPKRAELDYADRIDTTRQSVTMFADDGDETGRALAGTALARLEQQRDEATNFYQAVAVIAGVLEGGASLAMPSGLLLFGYLAAGRRVERRAAALARARALLARRREAFAARMSGLLEQAGVAQDRLGPLLAGRSRADMVPPVGIGSATDPDADSGVPPPPTEPPPPDPRFDQA